MTTGVPFNIGQWLMGPDGIEFQMPQLIWHKWPLKVSHDNGLLFLRNSFFHPFHNTSWHSSRYLPQFHTNVKYTALQAICEGNVEKLERCLQQGLDPNSTLDYAQKHSAVTLASHLDNLEILHLLDLHGANLSQKAGKFGQTPLMAALMRWNVRIIDYLIERGVDPTVKDNFGFTAKEKAHMKSLRTIHSMLD